MLCDVILLDRSSDSARRHGHGVCLVETLPAHPEARALSPISLPRQRRLRDKTGLLVALGPLLTSQRVSAAAAIDQSTCLRYRPP